MGCGASRGIDVRPLSPVVPGSDAPNLTAGNGVVAPLAVSAQPQPQPESRPASVPTAPDTTADTPTTFTNMQGLPSPASTSTPTEEGAPQVRFTTEVTGSSADQRAQLEALTPRVRPKRPPGPAPPQTEVAAPALATPVTGLVLELPEPGQVGPPGATPGRQRKIPRPPPLEVGLTLELMEESEEEDSPIVARKSAVQVGISGATPRSIREIDQSGDYRGIGTPKRTGSPFLRGDAFDESEESDAMSSCSEDSTGIVVPFRSLEEQGQAISGSLRPTAPDWCWRLDVDPDRLRRALAMHTPTHPLASASPLVEISLPGCSLGPGALSVIASVLLEGSASNLRQTLQNLCLADNQLVGADPAAYKPTPDADLSGLNALADALRGHQTQREDRQTAALAILDLRRNVIGPKGISILASAVWTTGTASPLQLQRLQLSDNLVTGSVLCSPSPMATTTAIAAASDGERDGPIAPSHSDPPVGCSTGWAWQLDVSTGGFSCLLAHNQSLATPSFVLGLRKGARLHRLRQQLVSLELRKCYLGPDAANVLLKALMPSTTGTLAAQLHRLDLYHNRIGDQAAVALCHFAVTGSTPAAPHSSDSGIHELLLGFNGLTYSCCKPIGAALEMSAVDKTVTNNDNDNDAWQGEERGDSGISDIDNTGSADNDSRMPGNRWGLRVLDLTWNALEPRGIKALCKSVSAYAAAAKDAVTLKRVRLTDGMEDSLDLHTLQQLLDGTGSTSGQERDTVGAALDVSFVATKQQRKIQASDATNTSIYDPDGSGEDDEDTNKEMEAASTVAGFEIVLRRRVT